MNAHLSGIDFAALATLRLVYRRMSFTQAARELDIKQSSVSYTIGRLRVAFSDPLFVRQGGGIAPTERCIEIVEAAERILSDAERAAMPSQFDPATSTASVAISATYLSRLVLMPTVTRELRREAPGISVELITGFTNASQHLLSGRADLALSPVPVDESGIYGRKVFDDPYACLMDPQNPLAEGKLTPERFASMPHLVVHYGELWHPLYLGLLAQRGLNVNVAFSTPDPADIEFMIPGTDLVVAMPGRICRQFAEGLHICPCPVPAVAAINMYWPARLNRSPLQEWLRAKIFRVANEVSET
jgi:DNA-binding transcriptional LysR family regulator